jgi:hypothetical protein
MPEQITQPPRPHGVGTRGASLARDSVLFEGSFGRIFRALPPADFGETEGHNLEALGTLARRMTAAPQPPKDGPDEEESGIPAAYTYLGQFVDHDLTFDPASSLQRQNDPQALHDFRTPRFDLDSLYGRGPQDQPYLYEIGRSFLPGRPLGGAASNREARDLPRSQGIPRRAIIGDPRNDENVIVSQLHGLFLRFHNRLARSNPAWTFERVQREVRRHYQWVVLHDLLPHIVAGSVLDRVLPNRREAARTDRNDLLSIQLELYHWKNQPYLPLEFSGAAYRFGHSMVRPGYRLNETVPPLPIVASDSRSLAGFREFPDSWAIDWNLFADLQPRSPLDSTRLQLAYKIDTSLVNPLSQLPPSVAVPGVLAQRNLVRGWRLRLPSGQAVARAMGVVPLSDKDIKIGKATGNPADTVGSIDEIHPDFADNCPLWTYVLAETITEQVGVRTAGGAELKLATPRLGPVGGQIVAETFVGLLAGDSHAFLATDPRWKPSTLAHKQAFGLRELIAFALE